MLLSFPYPERSSDGSGLRNNSHPITLTRGVKAATKKIDLHGRLIQAADRNQTHFDRRSQPKTDLNLK